MVYERALWLPKVLRDAGIEVVEYDGWKSRGLSEARPFKVEHIVWHHDASAPGDSPGVPAYMIRNFASAGAQVWVDRRGRWHIIASGRAAHAGKTRVNVTNENSLGIETDHTTGESWEPALLTSLRKGTAAILKHIGGTPGKNLHFHKSICYPVGRKVDPDGLTLALERTRVFAAMKSPVKAPPVVDNRPSVSMFALTNAATRASWSRVTPVAYRDDIVIVEKALAAEGVRSYQEWQRKLGYSGKDADGVPGSVTLKKLGDKHGFRVVK